MKLCSIEGCNRKAKYAKTGICQTHYHRMWRTGKYEKTPKGRVYRTSNAKGYQMLYEPNHPLAMKNGYVYEHRKLAHDNNLFRSECDKCGKKITWGQTHIDHIDEQITNNSISNLRCLCRGCNTHRFNRPTKNRKGVTWITYNGVTLTAEQWGKRNDVPITGATIKNRLKKGWGYKEAIYTPSPTCKKRLRINKKVVDE